LGIPAIQYVVKRVGSRRHILLRVPNSFKASKDS
jgi:hypothetical protein